MYLILLAHNSSSTFISFGTSWSSFWPALYSLVYLWTMNNICNHSDRLSILNDYVLMGYGGSFNCRKSLPNSESKNILIFLLRKCSYIVKTTDHCYVFHMAWYFVITTSNFILPFFDLYQAYKLVSLEPFTKWCSLHQSVRFIKTFKTLFAPTCSINLKLH
jgi:hypothetical protein